MCKKIGDLQTFTARTTNKELTKRDIVLVDKTNREVKRKLVKAISSSKKHRLAK